MSEPPFGVTLPLRIILVSNEAYAVRDAAGYAVSIHYFEDGNLEMRQVRRRLSREDALACAQAAARAITAMVSGSDAP